MLPSAKWCCAIYAVSFYTSDDEGSMSSGCTFGHPTSRCVHDEALYKSTFTFTFTIPPVVCCPFVNTYLIWRDTSLLSGGILVKLVTNIRHVSGNCWNGSWDQRPKFQVTTRPSTVMVESRIPLVWHPGLLVAFSRARSWIFFTIKIVGG